MLLTSGRGDDGAWYQVLVRHITDRTFGLRPGVVMMGAQEGQNALACLAHNLGMAAALHYAAGNAYYEGWDAGFAAGHNQATGYDRT